MSVRWTALTACVVGWVLGGCIGATQHVPAPPTLSDSPRAQARVVVVCPEEGGGEFVISDGTQVIGQAKPGCYFCWDRAPGKAVITSKGKFGCSVELNVRAGQTYYVLHVVYPGLWESKPGLKRIDGNRAREAMAKCKLASYQP